MHPDIRIAIIRPIGAPIEHSFYNSQEIGLARGLAKCGVSVDVFVAGHATEVLCRDMTTKGAERVRLFELPFIKLPLIDQAIYPKLHGLLAKGAYDFIQVNEENELTSFLAARYAKKNDIPVVVYQGMYSQLTGRIYAAYQTVYDKLLLPGFKKNITQALVKSTRAGQHLQRKGFTEIQTLPVGLDPQPFANPKEKNWREEFHIPKNDNILLYVGIFEKRRNIDFMLDLAKKMSNDNVTLVMAGTGPEHSRIKARIKEEQINNVRLPGVVKQGDLPHLYQESAIFLLPSTYEIYGMVVVEAMYFGVPVISTRTAGPEDIIDSGENGYLIDGLDQMQWVTYIKKLIRDPDKRKTLGRHAARKIQSSLTWDHVAKDYFEQVIHPAVKP